MTAREIYNLMLEHVSDEYDKSDGSFIFNALMPVAEQLVKVDSDINKAIQKMSISNLSGDELAQRVKERTGIERKEATRAIGEVTVTGTGVINIGDLFETANGVQFRSVETKQITNSGKVKIEAVVAGSSGNVPANTIIYYPVTLAGFSDVTNEQPTYDGFDAESDEDLLQRYYDRIRTPATSGNINHYIQWAKEVPGVGDVRIQPLWDGDNTVKIIIIDQEKQPASQQLVDVVQEHIDPNSSGRGEGVAPIGAYCTVVSATGKNINVNATVTLEGGYSLQQVVDTFTENLKDYLASIAFKEDAVSYARIGSVLLGTEGVADYLNLTVNGGTENIPINADEVAVVGVIGIE